jgi:hypothetical protein
VWVAVMSSHCATALSRLLVVALLCLLAQVSAQDATTTSSGEATLTDSGTTALKTIDIQGKLTDCLAPEGEHNL